MLQKRGPNVIYIKEDLHDEREIGTKSFYKSKGYIPPLERKNLNLKRKFEDDQDESSTEKNNVQVTKPAKKQKTKGNVRNLRQKTKNSKAQKKSSAARSKNDCSEVPVINASMLMKKLPEPRSPSFTVSLSSVLARKRAETEPQKRKFFKSRSSDISLRLDNIIPVNGKSPAPVLKAAVKSSATKRDLNKIDKTFDKENLGAEAELNKSSGNASVQEDVPRKPQKWIESSFDNDSIDSERGETKEKQGSENMLTFKIRDSKVMGKNDSISEPTQNVSNANITMNGSDVADQINGQKYFGIPKPLSEAPDNTVAAKTNGAATGDQFNRKHSQETMTEKVCELPVGVEPSVPQDFLDANPEDSEKTAEESALHESSLSFVEDYCSDSGDSSAMYPVFQRYIGSSKFNRDIPSSPTIASHEPNKPPLKTMLPKGKELFTIDAGQNMDPVQCDSCNMMYQVGVEHDESLHIKFHKKYLARLKFQGWKKERVIGSFYDGRVIMVTRDDPPFMLKKVNEVLEIVNRELGFVDQNLSIRPNATFLLYVHVDKQIVGCLVAESITKAYRMIGNQDHLEQSDLAIEGKKDCDSWCARSEPVKALCGINRLWVAGPHRKQGMATRMVDCLRCHFLYGYVIKLEELAFLDPSYSGQRFAAKYAKTSDFLVYK